jgi:acyl carrier protein
VNHPARQTNLPMTATIPYAEKSAEQIRSDLRGFAPSCVEAALRYREDGQFETFARMLPGMIEFHLPNGATKPPAELKDSLRLNQDLGLDSLALTEMAFKLDDLFGIPIETREVMGVETVRDLKSFLRRKLDLS